MVRRVANLALGKVVTLVLAATALALGVATFALFSGGVSLQLRPSMLYALVLANAFVLLLLGAVLAGRITRVWVERRRGSAGSRLHVRLVHAVQRRRGHADDPGRHVSPPLSSRSASSPGSTTGCAPR